MWKVRLIADPPRVLVDYYERNAPEFLTAPKKWTGAYQTDCDHFKSARKPVLF